jgi:hypothetical protein
MMQLPSSWPKVVTHRDTPHIIRKRPEATPAYIADW